MSLDNNNGSGVDSVGDFLSNLQMLIVNGLVKRLSLLEKLKTFLEQLEVDSLGVIKVSLFVNLFDLLVNLFFSLFNDSNNITLSLRIGSASHTSHVASHWLIKIDQVEDAGVKIELFLQFLLNSLSDS